MICSPSSTTKSHPTTHSIEQSSLTHPFAFRFASSRTVRYATQTIKMTKFGMVYVNNVLCIFFLLPVAYMNGEMSVFFASSGLHTWDYAFKNLFAGFVGFFLNFASLNCVSVTGPTTYAIVGSLNKVPVTFLGWMLFQEKLSPKTWFFVAVSLVGGFLYTYVSLEKFYQLHSF